MSLTDSSSVLAWLGSGFTHMHVHILESMVKGCVCCGERRQRERERERMRYMYILCTYKLQYVYLYKNKKKTKTIEVLELSR